MQHQNDAKKMEHGSPIAINTNIITLPLATRHAAVGQMLRFSSHIGPDCQFYA